MKRRKGVPSYLGSHKLYFILGVTIVAESISIIAQSLFLARAITFLFQGAALQTVFKDIRYFLIAFLLKHLLSQFQQCAAERFAEQTVKMLSEKLTAAYFCLGPRFVQMNGTGRLVTLGIEGMEQIKAYLELTIPRMIRTVIIPLVVLLYVFTLDITSAVILIVTVPITIVFMILLGMAAQHMADKQYKTYRILSNHFIDTLKGLETLKFLGQSKKHGRKVSRVSEDYRKATMRTLRVAFLSSFALDFFTSLSIAFVAVGLGFRLIDGAISLLPALTILILAPEYFLPIRQVGTDYHATLDGQIALEQVESFIEQKSDSPQQVNEKELNWNATSSMKLSRMYVSHEESEQPFIKELDFSWQGNGMVGVVGATGAGKSTFIDLLAGFLQPNKGSVELNGEAQSFTSKQWQKNIAYIPQHPYIFPTTVANNIRFYEPRATDKEVKKVIDQIGLQSLVQQLPNGIHENIGEGGRRLSGGQEQRIAMARALLSERPILLLDEPTAHLDIETEYENKQVMLRLFEGKLVFVATHRLHWMKEMDHIIVLDQGRICERGTHDELLKKNGVYTRLANYIGEDGEK